MISKLYSVIFFGSLIGSTLCVIPQGEIQIGPIFGQAGKFFTGGNKHFEVVFDKGGHLKPFLAKKVLLGVGAIGAGALAAGGAALPAKKIPHLSHGWGWGSGNNQGYAQGQYNNYNNYNNHATGSSGWSGSDNSGYYQTHSTTADVKFPASAYPTASEYGNTNNYPSTEYGYPQNEWQGSNSYGSSGGSFGWSR